MLDGPPRVECRQGPLALNAVAFFFVADLSADFFFERLTEVEGDVGGLEVLWIGVRDVVNQRAECSAARNRGWFFAASQ